MKYKILDFYADWCQPCKMMKPMMDELEKEYDVQKIDIDSDQTLTDKYGVMSIPTLVILKDGKETKRFNGVISKKEIIGSLT